MRYFKYLALVVSYLLLVGCPGNDDDHDLKVSLVNNSPDKIYFYISQEMTDAPTRSLETSDIWKFSLYSRNYETKNVIIYIWKSTTIHENDWDYLKENGIYDAKYDLSLEELQNMEYTVVYAP